MRPYNTTLAGKQPDRTGGHGGLGGGLGGGGLGTTGTATFGASTTQAARDAARDAARLERDRLASQNEFSELTPEQQDEINQAVYTPSRTHQNPSILTLLSTQFDLFDLDKDQRIDYHELKVAMKALGFDLPKPEILAILTNHGIPPVPAAPSHHQPYPVARLQITLETFQAVMAKRIRARDPREEVLRAFSLFDEGNKGHIVLGDLKRVAKELGEDMEEDELRAMIEEFDLDGDGGINREEFLAICLS
jgi:centrin-3